MPDLIRVCPLGGPPRGHVGLERHLDHHCATNPGHLGEQGGGVGHVLEHVGEDPEVVLARRCRHVGAVELLHPLDPGTGAGDGYRGAAQLESREGAPEASPGELPEQGSVAAADVEDALRVQRRAGTQLDHVVGLAEGTEGPPAGIQLGLLGGAGVRLLVEGGECLGVVDAHVGVAPVGGGWAGER